MSMPYEQMLETLVPEDSEADDSELSESLSFPSSKQSNPEITLPHAAERVAIYKNLKKPKIKRSRSFRHVSESPTNYSIEPRRRRGCTFSA